MATKDITDVQVLRTYALARAASDPWNMVFVWPYDVLMAESGMSYEACNEAMERAHSLGLIDCSNPPRLLRGGSLTRKGAHLLAQAWASPAVRRMLAKVSE